MGNYGTHADWLQGTPAANQRVHHSGPILSNSKTFRHSMKRVTFYHFARLGRSLTLQRLTDV